MRFKAYTLTIPNNQEFSVPQLKMLLKQVEKILGRRISLNPSSTVVAGSEDENAVLKGSLPWNLTKPGAKK